MGAGPEGAGPAGAGPDHEGAAAAHEQLLGWLRELERRLDAAGAGEELAGAEQDAEVALVYLAHGDVVLDEDELHGAIRRAVLVRTRSGSPLRDIDPDEHAVVGLADDLDSPAARAELLAALAEVAELVAGLPRLERTATELLADPDRAWRLLAASLLADHLESGE